MEQTQPEKLVRFVAGQLVDHPDALETHAEPLDDGVKIILDVAEEDRGRVIGKGGRTARAIRAVVKASGAVHDSRFQLEIKDP